MKVMAVFGTRPEAIKMCPLIKEFQKNARIEMCVCVTGQHREMLDQVLNVFHIKPDYDLNVMRDDQRLTELTANIINKMDVILQREKPDLVFVHGDTTTAFATALVCFYLRLKVAHVEAGLRTNHIFAPYPEEFNRQAIDIVTDFYFAPTEQAKQNLLKEGKPEAKISVTGNTVIDALKTTVMQEYHHGELEWARGSRLILFTAHRRENAGMALVHMFRAIRRIVQTFADVKVIYPIHLNPQIRTAAVRELGGISRIHLIEPLDVLDFHNFMARSYLILTDSGGIQEEAPALGKPVLVMRDTTERPEGIKAGTLRLVGTEENEIYKACAKLLEDDAEYKKMSQAVNPYGDGFAAKRIVNYICENCLSSGR